MEEQDVNHDRSEQSQREVHVASGEQQHGREQFEQLNQSEETGAVDRAHESGSEAFRLGRGDGNELEPVVG